MALLMNLNAGGSFSVPRGFPVRLVSTGERTLSGVIPRGAAGVTATLATELGTANAHLALYTMPSASGGPDLAPVVQTDLVGLTTKVGQTISVAVPTTAAPVCYVARLWIDAVAGSQADTISRDGVTVVAKEPAIPTGVLVASIAVS
jgi:hypothetical protein